MKQNEIFTTKKYEIFKTLEGNRAISEGHVQHLIESMKIKYLPVPIIINKNYEVIDGQHRLESAKRLGLVVHFIMRPEFGLKEVQILNENQKSWATIDFAKSFIDLGKKDYEQYLTFVERYCFPARESIKMLSGDASHKEIMKEFRAGNFKVKNYPNACEIAEKITEIGKYVPFYKERLFVDAMLQIFRSKNYNQKTMIHKLKQFPSLIIRCVNTEKYILMMEEIFNYKALKENKIRFI
jgi:hypothetical protein